MCTKYRRIESRPLCFREPNPNNNNNNNNNNNKICITLLQQILNTSHVDLMTENKLCKTISQRTYFVFYDMNVQ